MGSMPDGTFQVKVTGCSSSKHSSVKGIAVVCCESQNQGWLWELCNGQVLSKRGSQGGSGPPARVAVSYEGEGGANPDRCTALPGGAWIPWLETSIKHFNCKTRKEVFAKQDKRQRAP